MSITYRPGRCVKWRSHLHPVGCFKLLWRHSNFTSVATSNSSWPYAGSGSLKRWMALVKPTSYRSYGDQHHSPSIHHVTSCTDFHLDEALMKRWRFPRKRQMDFRRSRSAMISGSAKHMDCPVLLLTWWETTHFQHLWFGRVTVCQASAFAKMLSGSFPKIRGFKALRLCTFLQTFQDKMLRNWCKSWEIAGNSQRSRLRYTLQRCLSGSIHVSNRSGSWILRKNPRFSMVFNGFQFILPWVGWNLQNQINRPSHCGWQCVVGIVGIGFGLRRSFWPGQLPHQKIHGSPNGWLFLDRAGQCSWGSPDFPGLNDSGFSKKFISSGSCKHWIRTSLKKT